MSLIFAPAFSPNRNLIKRVWRLLKKIVLSNALFLLGGAMNKVLMLGQ
jgi:hypothetical protein